MAEEKKAKDETTGTAVTREPFRELGDWQPFGGRFPSLFDRLMREFDEEWTWPSARRGWMPALDVHETDDEYTVTVELPGARKEDITVEFSEGVLTVRGEKKSEREEKQEKRRFVERRYGTFSRSFSLPGDADGDRIEASFQDGVLTLTIPKSEAARPRTVSIK